MQLNMELLLMLFFIINIYLVQSQTQFDQLSKFNATHFAYDLLHSTPRQGLGGKIYVAGLRQMPVLNQQGIAYVLFELKPCALILPHIHPRAGEFLYAINASKLQVGFSEENGRSSRMLVNSIKTGLAAFIPMGLIHFVMNLDCQPASFLSALNNEDFGITTITNMFNFPTYTLASTFNLTENQVIMLKAGIPSSPAQGVEDCLKNCGINSAVYYKNLEEEMKQMISSSLNSNLNY
jgi:oxalate decarboxylase/phosphoglucose isomerase-like protein (cupin superfamily)